MKFEKESLNEEKIRREEERKKKLAEEITADFEERRRGWYPLEQTI